MRDRVILIALLCIIAAEIWWISSFTEGFASATDFSTEYPATDHTDMTPDEDDDGRDLPWIASWSEADKRARRGQNCNPTYTQIGPQGTMIYTTTKSCEDGMAHTRIGDRIYLPDNINTVMRSDTVRHELIHIYQRRNPDVWANFYRRNWSFILGTQPPKDLPKEILDGRRSNPDTWTTPWPCWMGRWWPIPVYKDNYNPRLRDVNLVFWDAWKKQAFNEPPPEWYAFFGTPAQPEHPHELAACYIVSEDSQSEAGRRLMTWWNSTGNLKING